MEQLTIFIATGDLLVAISLAYYTDWNFLMLQLAVLISASSKWSISVLKICSISPAEMF